MCNLNILIRKNTRKKNLLKVIPSFLMAVTSNSYADNSDGDGFYAGGILERSVNKIDLFKYKSILIDSNIILTHQRISTSGFSVKYNHPFINKDFVLIHNGIMNDFLGKKGSDTSGFFKQFCKQFYLNEGDREERIKNSIKDLLDNLERGSFSMAILDRVTNNLYYFKNDETDIYIYSNSELLYITTLEENKIFLSMFGIRFWGKEVKDNRIYRISAGEEIKIKIIGRIKKFSSSSNFYNWGTYKKKNEEILKGDCANCNEKTMNWDIMNACWICKDCEKFYKCVDYRGMGI